MENRTENIILFNTIKQLLKAKKITYKGLSSKLQMSESGLKKIFKESNCSLEKLFKICHVLDIHMSDLFDLIKNPLDGRRIVVGQDLDNLLSHKPRLYYLLRALQTHGHQTIQTNKNNLYDRGFNDQDFEQLKAGLVINGTLNEDESLFSLKKSCLSLPVESKLRWLITSQVGAKVFKEQTIKQQTKKERMPLLWSQHLSKSDELQLNKDIYQILKKYEKRSSLYADHVPSGQSEITYLIVPARVTPGIDLISNLDEF